MCHRMFSYLEKHRLPCVVIALELAASERVSRLQTGFRWEAEGGVFYNLFSCWKAFDTKDTPKEKTEGEKEKQAVALKKY